MPVEEVHARQPHKLVAFLIIFHAQVALCVIGMVAPAVVLPREALQEVRDPASLQHIIDNLLL